MNERDILIFACAGLLLLFVTAWFAHSTSAESPFPSSSPVADDQGGTAWLGQGWRSHAKRSALPEPRGAAQSAKRPASVSGMGGPFLDSELRAVLALKAGSERK